MSPELAGIDYIIGAAQHFRDDKPNEFPWIEHFQDLAVELAMGPEESFRTDALPPHEQTAMMIMRVAMQGVVATGDMQNFFRAVNQMCTFLSRFEKFINHTKSKAFEDDDREGLLDRMPWEK